MIDFAYKDVYSFEDLREIMALLREHCPWDREQTHSSIRQNLLEEAYEVCEGIDRDDPAILREELGDLLLQVLFHVRMEEERGRVTMDGVLTELAEKLIRRHPNIFGEQSEQPRSAEEMLDQWESIKRAEKGGHAKSVEAVARSLPELMRSQKVQGRALKAGFGFVSSQQVYRQLEEELSEMKAATGTGSLEDEIGDVLFTVVNLARVNGLDAELALERSCDKFARRFAKMQSICEDLSALTPEEKEKLWNRAKRECRAEDRAEPAEH